MHFLYFIILSNSHFNCVFRDIESCTGSTSGSYFGCLSTSSKSEANSPGQLSGIDNVGHDAFQGLQFGGMYSYLPYGLNMQGGDSTNMQSMLGMDQRQSTALAYDAGRNYPSTLPSHGIGNHFLPDTPADSAFADYNNYQVFPVLSFPVFSLS